VHQPAEPQRRRGPGRPFPKGASGNPGGRVKPGSLDIAALARSHAPEAIAALVRGLTDPKHYVHAAQVLLERGFGRPVQPIIGNRPQSITLMHLVAAREVSEEIQRALEAANGTTPPPTIDAAPSQEPPDLCAPARE
jgi:hypothetical protein